MAREGRLLGRGWLLRGRMLVMIAPLLFRWIHRQLRRLGYRRTLAQLVRWSPAPGTKDDVVLARALARRFNDGAADAEWIKCLHRALALFWVLRWLRMDPHIVTGMGMAEGKLVFHAWVQLKDAVINESADVRSRYPVEWKDLDQQMLGKPPSAA